MPTKTIPFTLTCQDLKCQKNAEYYLVFGCVENMHICDYRVCLTHMMKFRGAYLSASEFFLCPGCYEADKTIRPIDDLIIQRLNGEFVDV